MEEFPLSKRSLRFSLNKIYGKALIEQTLKVHHAQFFPGELWPFWIGKGTFHSLFNTLSVRATQSTGIMMKPN